MAKYIPYDDEETHLIPINFKAQLQRGSFEYALNDLIENKLDLLDFDSLYKNDKEGRPAYNPAILLKIILFSYYRGITSSREMEWYCRHHVIFMALACGQIPHFTTIAAFISGHPEKVTDLFEQVLSVCHEQGLLATVDKKHQIIVDAQAIGSGQEQQTLIPVIEAVAERFKRLALNDDIFDSATVR